MTGDGSFGAVPTGAAPPIRKGGGGMRRTHAMGRDARRASREEMRNEARESLLFWLAVAFVTLAFVGVPLMAALFVMRATS